MVPVRVDEEWLALIVDVSSGALYCIQAGDVAEQSYTSTVKDLIQCSG